LLVAERLGIAVIAVDYRMPPMDEPFPAAVDDAVRVYLELLESYDASAIAVGGTSAGGGLTLALVHRLKAIGAPLPGALYAGTAWADLTKTGDTLYTNEGLDRILVQYEGGLQAAAALYVGVSDWKDPLVSPVYGDFAGFPPTILTTGTRDLFLSDVVRTHRKMRAAGVEADLHVYEAMSHAGYAIWTDTPESRDMYSEVGAFLAGHLD
jgi:acetyl esterase/lipase